MYFKALNTKSELFAKVFQSFVFSVTSQQTAPLPAAKWW